MNRRDFIGRVAALGAASAVMSRVPFNVREDAEIPVVGRVTEAGAGWITVTFDRTQYYLPVFYE